MEHALAQGGSRQGGALDAHREVGGVGHDAAVDGEELGHAATRQAGRSRQLPAVPARRLHAFAGQPDLPAIDRHHAHPVLTADGEELTHGCHFDPTVTALRDVQQPVALTPGDS